MNRLDFKGLNCPQPVVETKKYLDEHPDANPICVVVDNKAASENVSRFLSIRSFSTEIKEDNKEFHVIGTRTGDCADCVIPELHPQGKNTLVMFAHNTLGSGSRELGEKLMVNFIKTLAEIKDSLWRLVFVNEGVTLTVEGSETFAALKELESQGISILVCGTCLDYFKLLEFKKVGETTNMLDIMTSLQVAEKVINL